MTKDRYDEFDAAGDAASFKKWDPSWKRVFSIKPGESALFEHWIPNDLERLTNLIDGGHLKQLPIMDGLMVLLDEEGALKRLVPNFKLMGILVQGPAVLVRYNDAGDLESVTDDDIAFLSAHLQR